MLFLSNKNLQSVGIYKHISSAQWKTKLNDLGTFEFHISADSQYLSDIKIDYFVHFNGRDGVIAYREKNDDGSAVKITGYDLKKMLEWRLCYGGKTGNLETVIKSYVSEAFCTPGARKIPNFRVAPSQNRGNVVEWNNDKLVTALETVKGLCNLEQWGFTIYISGSDFVFDIIIPTDKSESIIFAPEYKNLSGSEFKENAQNEKNVALYLKETETTDSGGNTTKVTTIEEYNPYSKSGLDRKEGAAENNATTEKAASYLISNAIQQTVSAMANSKILYGSDYDIGDYVTTRLNTFDGKIDVVKQITEVKEIWEKNDYSTEPTFS